MNLKATAAIQYAASAAAIVLALFAGYRSFVAWRLYSSTEEAVVRYNSGNIGPAHESLGGFTGSFANAKPEVAAFEAHLLSLQDYHDRAIKILENSGLSKEGIIKLALASEKMFAAKSGSDAKEEIALLEQAADSYQYPDAYAALGGAYLRSGDFEKAGTILNAAAQDAGRLTFDGLLALYANLGAYQMAQEEFRNAVENFKKIIELLPRRKVPAIPSAREEILESAERGVALACAEWLTSKKLKPGQRKEAIEYVSGLLEEKQGETGRPKDRWELSGWRSLIFNALGLAHAAVGMREEALDAFICALRELRKMKDADYDLAKQSITLNRAIVAAVAFAGEEGASGDASQMRTAAKQLASAASGERLKTDLRYAALNMSARLYAAARKENKAIEVLKQALELKPDDLAAAINMAVCLDRQDKNAEALKYYEKALKLEPGERRKAIEKRMETLKERQ